MSGDRIIGWLLEGDPAIRRQVMRDLTDEPEAAVAFERSRIHHEGWGKALLDRQAPGGWWHANDRGWMITMDALALLREVGLDPSSDAARVAISRVRRNLRWESLGNRPYFEGETEACINGAILAFGSYFGERCDRIVERLLDEQLADGGWNCEAPPSARSSFNSTIRVLEGLLEHERVWGASAAVSDARRRGHEYLLERHLFRRLSTGEVVNSKWMAFTFPTTWRYDVLRGLDYLRSAGLEFDERAAQAIQVVKERRREDGRWPMDHLHPDRLGFAVESEIGAPSRWNTLRALRVLRWSSASHQRVTAAENSAL